MEQKIKNLIWFYHGQQLILDRVVEIKVSLINLFFSFKLNFSKNTIKYIWVKIQTPLFSSMFLQICLATLQLVSAQVFLLFFFSFFVHSKKIGLWYWAVGTTNNAFTNSNFTSIKNFTVCSSTRPDVPILLYPCMFQFFNINQINFFSSSCF